MAILLAAFTVLPPAIARARKWEAAVNLAQKEFDEVMVKLMIADARGALRHR